MAKPEIYINREGEIGLQNLADLMRAYPNYAQRAVASALKSEGYRLKGILQDTIEHGGPENEPWPKLHRKSAQMGLGQ